VTRSTSMPAQEPLGLGAAGRARGLTVRLAAPVVLHPPGSHAAASPDSRVATYHAGMARKTMKVCVCDVCGHRWIPEVEDPPLCPRKACRSTLWNRGGVDGRTKAAKQKVGHTMGISKGRTAAGKPKTKA
jgi:hypothetical protein